jgi:hypothetical protein
MITMETALVTLMQMMPIESSAIVSSHTPLCCSVSANFEVGNRAIEHTS